MVRQRGAAKCRILTLRPTRLAPRSADLRSGAFRGAFEYPPGRRPALRGQCQEVRPIEKAAGGFYSWKRLKRSWHLSCCNGECEHKEQMGGRLEGQDLEGLGSCLDEFRGIHRFGSSTLLFLLRFPASDPLNGQDGRYRLL